MISDPETSEAIFKRQLNQNHSAVLLCSLALVSEKLQCFKTVTSQTRANGRNIFSVPPLLGSYANTAHSCGSFTAQRRLKEEVCVCVL